jgi:hypothetical protein
VTIQAATGAVALGPRMIWGLAAAAYLRKDL